MGLFGNHRPAAEVTISGPAPDGRPATVEQAKEDRRKAQAQPKRRRQHFWGEDA